jgi:hypothetical protein
MNNTGLTQREGWMMNVLIGRWITRYIDYV